MEEKVISGCLHSLPSLQGNGVQVFLSSTFTDYAVERNMLMKEAVPVLREYCQARYLDFQISDMRWGVRDEAQDDHATTDLCLSEIHRCQQTSRGPYFVCFLGDKYGYRPYPNIINQEEFEILYKCAKDLRKETRLLDEWYFLDENAVPAEYVLQPISSKFPHYNDESEENQHKRTEEKNEWNAINKLLVCMFRDSAEKAYKDRMISDQIRHKYFMSVTENEVYHGIFNADQVNTRALCFTRKFKSINYDDRKAGRFEDLDGKQKDDEAKTLLYELKEQKVPGTLDKCNIYSSELEWRAEGVDINFSNHVLYLEDVKITFIREIKRLIDAHVDVCQRRKSTPALWKEILHQSLTAQGKCKVFCGRENLVGEIKQKLGESFGKELSADEMSTVVLSVEQQKEQEDSADHELAMEEQNQIKEFMEKNGIGYAMEERPIDMNEAKHRALEKSRLGRYNKPLIVCGGSGSGKTALMAYVASQLDEWYAAPLAPVKIIRFLGTSTHSSYIHDTLVSSVRQIWLNYDMKPEFDDEISRNFMFATAYFHALLSKVDTTSKPLFLIFDSIDQLHPRDHAHSLNWMPKELPPGVHLIISTLPDIYGIEKNAKVLISDKSRFVAMCAMDARSGEATLWKWMESFQRTLTNNQKCLIMEKFSNCPQPLFMLLAAREASLWRSYATMDENVLGDSILSAINKLFDRLETKHGKVMVAKSLGYLTASRQGLTDTELEDILSLDDEVLQDTYIYHLPPDTEVIRLPPSLWRRLRIDLGEYLVIRQASGKDTITWYHRQFIEAARHRYLADDIVVDIHSTLVDYFDGKWASTAKPLELYKKKNGSYPNALRGVPAQPLQFGPSKYNLRKLQEMPLHLVKSNQLDVYISKVCRSFEWLHTKCKVYSVIDILGEMDMALTVLNKWKEMGEKDGLDRLIKEMTALRSCLVLASDSIQRNPDNLALQLIGQFMPGDENLPDGLRTLQKQAMEWARRTETPMLVPKTKCLPSPGGEVLLSLDNAISLASDPAEHEVKMAVQKLGPLVYVVDHQSNIGDVIKIYNTDNYCELVRQQHMPNTDFMTINLVANDKYLLCDVYIKRDKYTPEYRKILLTSNLSPVQNISKCAEVFAVSDNGVLVFMQTINDQSRKYSTILNTETAEEVKLLEEKLGEFKEALFSDSGDYLVTIGEEKSVWDVRSGQFLHCLTQEKDSWGSFSSHHSNIKAYTKVLSGDRLAGRGAAYNDSCVIMVWDITTGELLTQLKGHSYEVDFLSLSRSLTRAVSGTASTSWSSDRGDSKQFRVWDLERYEQIACSKITCIYTALSFLGTSESLIFVAEWFEKKSLIFKLEGDELKPVYELFDHTEKVVFAECNFNEQVLLTASVDNTVKVWSMDKIHHKIQDLLERCPTTEAIAEEAEQRRKQPSKLGEGKLQTTAFAVSRDGKSAMAGTADGWVLLYDLQTNKVIKHQKHRSQTGEEDDEPIDNMIASSNAKLFITNVSQRVCLWDATTGEFVRELIGPTVHSRKAACSCMAESADTLVLGYGGMECYGDIYDLTSGEKVKSLPGLYGFEQVAISSDGKKVVSHMFEMPVIYNVETEESSLDMSNADVMMCGATFIVIGPADKYVVGGGSDGSVRVLDLNTSKYKFRFQHRSTVAMAAFTENNKSLVTSGFSTILIWSLVSGQLQYSLSRHQDFVMDLTFTCDGRYLVTCSKDKQVLVWSMETMDTIASFYSHAAVKKILVAPGLSSIVYCPDTVAYLGILQPNPALDAASKGEKAVHLPESMQQAQAIAFTFSSERITTQSAKTCTLI